MAKVKYYYDPNTLSYQRIERKKRNVFGTIVLLALGGFFCMLLGLFALSPFFESPNEKKQKRELEFLKLNEELHRKNLAELTERLEEIQERDNNIYRLYFEVNPIPEEVRKAGFGGVNRYKMLEGYDNSEIISSTAENIDILKKQLVIQSKSLDEIVELAKNKEKLLASIPAIQPVKKQDLTRMASGYGWRPDPFTKARKMHKGMDFTSPRGTPIYASGNGVVIRADQGSTGYGKHVRIDHGFGYVTLYAHMSKYNVKKGQKVKRGDIIGFVGSTGRSKAPHLHYEVIKDKRHINPINFYYGNLSPEEFEAMQKAAQIEGQSLD